jgi:uncharacterized protein (DUF1697 family)
MERMVALLRAVNVGGRKLAMAELRALCAELGWSDVATYIQSGNIVFAAGTKPAAAEAQLEKAVAGRFGMEVPAIVRTRAQWRAYVPPRAFGGAARDEPSRLMMILSKRPPDGDAEAALQARATAGERVKRAGDALWVHFPEGLARSKLTPSLIDRLVGSPATARNYRTVVRLREMLGR